MERLGPLHDADRKVLTDTQSSLEKIHALASQRCDSAETGVDILRQLRMEVYEDLNQILHEHLIIRAAEWLLAHARVANDIAWFWNPRQTGDSSEPDLRGIHLGDVLISAEVTASERPIGTIDRRMQTTLAKLSRMEGMKFYFVRTEPMRKRASTKVAKQAWDISVVLLNTSLAADEPASDALDERLASTL
ncbi:hypothetical protein [Burkholderia gladioli]|uniref:hypothetical protein n=1 Tax=Burkholderia gladioli TaxID=28095 RepID=UPI00163E83FB|nr:hypothetical protein [Burkholderia gladioli]